ncbi:hypoxia up-regulated protein 1-like, partial [Notothenia coriiceps]|uniref:Hypoxia up-regulated protein 1-like n=1 Tax=Notothenia coriiceps TaxID=8208 RepID=A0A6I9PA83_9TELE
FLQTWKNETETEQEKRSPKERPVLLSKDIESKVSLLERELNYLLNKAKFAKPKAKAKNSTSTDKSSKANNTTKEKVIPSTEESTDSKSESSEEVQPGEVPPTEESATNTDSDSQSQPTEESTTTGATEKTQPEKHIEDEL